jgi:hypothetical protein
MLFSPEFEGLALLADAPGLFAFQYKSRAAVFLLLATYLQKAAFFNREHAQPPFLHFSRLDSAGRVRYNTRAVIFYPWFLLQGAFV